MTVDIICVGIKGFLNELKIIENGIPSDWYWVPVLNYLLLQSMLLLLMMHLFYLLVFASFFLIMERKLPVRIAPWTLFVLLWYSSKKILHTYTLYITAQKPKLQPQCPWKTGSPIGELLQRFIQFREIEIGSPPLPAPTPLSSIRTPIFLYSSYFFSLICIFC
ncbi:hypothetical protein PS1_002451 [Malus domestica]